MAEYIPNFNPESDIVSVPTFEGYRARLEAGGTFFRAKDIGTTGNNISIEIITTSPSTVQLNVYGPQNVSKPIFSGKGNGKVNALLMLTNAVDETFILTSTAPLEFSVVGSVSGNIGTTKVSQVFKSNQIAFCIMAGNIPFQIGDKFQFNVNKKVETFTSTNNVNQNTGSSTDSTSTDSTTSTSTTTTTPSPAIGEIRTQVNAQSKFIAMPERGTDYVDKVGTDSFTGRSVRDSGDAEDGALMIAIPKTFLVGGAGFPSNPDGIKTGPTKALIHLNRSEDDNGVMKNLNQVYAWVGSDNVNGSFQPYE